MCELTWCQVPEVRGETGGSTFPSTFPTGLEKVSVIFVFGVILVPGLGVATAVALAPAGNQVICVTVGISQVRAATATSAVPAALLSSRWSRRCGVRSTAALTLAPTAP